SQRRVDRGRVDRRRRLPIHGPPILYLNDRSKYPRNEGVEASMGEQDRELERDRRRLDELIEEQEALFLSRRPRATELQRRAEASLAGGVTSSWQGSRPQPIWISHGQGSRVWDVDGNELIDLHNGYGVMAVGHA